MKVVPSGIADGSLSPVDEPERLDETWINPDEGEIGINVSRLRAYLALSPLERIDRHRRACESVLAFREAANAARRQKNRLGSKSGGRGLVAFGMFSAPFLELYSGAGPIHLLTRLPGIESFSELRFRAKAFDVPGTHISSAPLDDLMLMKSASSRPKDRIHVPELQAPRRLAV